MKPRWGVFALYLLVDWAIIALGFSIFSQWPNVFGFLLASVFVGIGQHGLIVLGHEAVHYRVCENRTLNEWVGGFFCMFPVGLTVSAYREFHFPHHKFANQEGDPEIPLRKAMGKNWLPPYRLGRGLRLWLQSYLGFSLREFIVFASGVPRGALGERLRMAAFWGVIGLTAYLSQRLIYLGLWQVAMMTTYFSFLRIQAWFEHSLPGAFANRYSLPNIFYRLFVPHNIWLHYEHHKYPTVPFYNLPRVRALDESDRIYAFVEMERELCSGSEHKASIEDAESLDLAA